MRFALVDGVATLCNGIITQRYGIDAERPELYDVIEIRHAKPFSG